MQHLSGIRAHHLVAKRFELAIASVSATDTKRDLTERLSKLEKNMEFLQQEKLCVENAQRRLAFTEIELAAKLSFIKECTDEALSAITLLTTQIEEIEEKIACIASKQDDLDYLEDKLQEIETYGEIIPGCGYFSISNIIRGISVGITEKKGRESVKRAWKKFKFNLL